MNRSFYLPRESGLHRLHPLTKLALVLALLLVGLTARWPLLPVALFALLIAPLALWGQIARALIATTFVVLLPFVVSVTLIQGFFYPGATQVIASIGPLALKAEGLLFAYQTAARILLLAGAGLLLLFSTHPADLTLALAQRGMPSALAYIIGSALQLIPQMQAQASAILDAQRARALETEGNLMVRVRALLPLLGPLVFGALQDVDERAMALEARAYSAPRRKTSYRVLRDSRTQSLTRWLLSIAAVALALWQVWGA